MFTNGFNVGDIIMQNEKIRFNAIRLDFPNH